MNITNCNLLSFLKIIFNDLYAYTKKFFWPMLTIIASLAVGTLIDLKSFMDDEPAIITAVLVLLSVCLGFLTILLSFITVSLLVLILTLIFDLLVNVKRYFVYSYKESCGIKQTRNYDLTVTGKFDSLCDKIAKKFGI